jgi:hypothetical protein
MQSAFWRTFIVFTLILALASTAAATEPSKFAVLTPQPGSLPTVGLNQEVSVRIDGDTVIQPNKIELRLDGWPLGVEPRVRPDQRELIFRLARLDSNRAMWSQLLGKPFQRGRMTAVPVSLEIDSKALSWNRPQSQQSDESPEPKISLIVYKTGWMTLGIFVSVLVAVLVALGCAYTTMIRDTLIPQMRLSDRPYSLGRLQMVVWFCLIFMSFLFIFAVTFDLNSVTPESFVLLGISGTTALGAIAIDQSKDSPVAQIQRNLEAMGIKTCGDADRLYTEAVTKKKGDEKAQTIFPGANIPSNSAARLAPSADPTIAAMWTEYRAQIKDLLSSGFLKDLVNDVNGPTIHRGQILIWTLILGVIYLTRVYMNLETPTFGANLLTLMGISGGVYLGFKIPEKQTTTA